MELLRAIINAIQHVTIYELHRVFYDCVKRFVQEVRVLDANCVTDLSQDIVILSARWLFLAYSAFGGRIDDQFLDCLHSRSNAAEAQNEIICLPNEFIVRAPLAEHIAKICAFDVSERRHFAQPFDVCRTIERN